MLQVPWWSQWSQHFILIEFLSLYTDLYLICSRGWGRHPLPTPHPVYSMLNVPGRGLMLMLSLQRSLHPPPLQQNIQWSHYCWLYLLLPRVSRVSILSIVWTLVASTQIIIDFCYKLAWKNILGNLGIDVSECDDTMTLFSLLETLVFLYLYNI